MFNRFTERARKVVILAKEEAKRFNHDYIGTEHLLLGLIKEGEGVAAAVGAGEHHDSTRLEPFERFVPVADVADLHVVDRGDQHARLDALVRRGAAVLHVGDQHAGRGLVAQPLGRVFGQHTIQRSDNGRSRNGGTAAKRISSPCRLRFFWSFLDLSARAAKNDLGIFVAGGDSPHDG